MSYEELIVRMYFQAATLSAAAWQVLYAAIANGIMQRTNRVRISVRRWALDAGMCRQTVVVGLQELGRYLPLENVGKQANGNAGVIILPLGWISTQSSLSFMSEEPQPGLWKFQCTTGDRPGIQDTHRPGIQDTHRPGIQDTTVLESRPVPTSKAMMAAYIPGHPVLESRPVSPESPLYIHACARVESNRIDSEAQSEPEDYLRIEKALCWKVEIPADQRESAEILKAHIRSYRDGFPKIRPVRQFADDEVLARLLALASVEQVCAVLCALDSERIPPKPSDMWFVSCVCDRLYGISALSVRARWEKKTKEKPSYESQTLPFEGQDWKGTVREMAAAKRMPA